MDYAVSFEDYVVLNLQGRLHLRVQHKLYRCLAYSFFPESSEEDSLEDFNFSVKILNRNSPSSSGLKAHGRITYVPGSRSNLAWTSLELVNDPEVPAL